MATATPRMASWAPAVVVTVVALALVGCSPGNSSGPEPSPDGQAASLPEVDPPLEFGDRIWLGDGHQVAAFQVAGSVLHTYNERGPELSQWELATGARLSSVPVDLAGGQPRESRQGSPVVFTEVDERMLLLVAYQHREPGVGTRPDAEYLRVRAYDADDGSLVWSEDVADAGLSEIRFLVSNSEHTVVVTEARDPAAARIGRDEADVAGATTVLDTGTGQLRQVWDPFVAYALDGDVVAGLSPDLEAASGASHAITGRHVFTGDTVWEDDEVPVSDDDYFGRNPGGGVLVQPARSRGTSAVVSSTLSTNLVRQVSTGEVLFEIDHDGAAVDCQFDGEQLLVCSHDPDDRGEPFLAVYDLHSRTPLWDLAEVSDGRDLPSTVTAAYNGVIYMDFASASRRPVALDARTGDDLAVDLSVAPQRVGAGYGLVYEEFGNLSIYPAVG